MVRHLAKLTLVAVPAAYIVPAHAVEALKNGNFESGLTRWTSYTTANGTIAEKPSTPTAPQPQNASVATFDVDGIGGATSALFLNAGRINGFGAPGAGGGVSQTFTTLGGPATFSADIAGYTRVGGAADLGLLSVLLDGVVLASHNFGGGPQAGPFTLFSTLDFDTNLTAGENTLSLQSTRRFAPARGTFAQYFDDISLNVVTPVPEPSTWAMLILGFAGVGFMAYRRRSGTTLVA